MSIAVKVELAPTDGERTASPSWVDVSEYVSLTAGIQCSRGRGRTSTTPEPGRLSLTFNNDDGRFTWGNPGGAYGLGLGENAQLRQPIRVTAVVDAVDIPLWTGYVDEWLAAWENGVRPRVRVTASDRLARLALLNLDDGAIRSEVLYDGPVAYYPLDEEAGYVSAGDRSGANVRPLSYREKGAGEGSVDFGAGASPDGVGTVAAFTQTSTTNGVRLAGNGPVSSSDAWTLECWVRASTRADSPMFVSVNDDGLGQAVVSFTHQAGTPNKVLVSHMTPTVFSQVFGTVGIDGEEWHHVAATSDGSTMTLYVDGAADGTDTAVTPMVLDQVNVGGGWISCSPLNTDTVWGGDVGQLAHVAVYDKALAADRVLQHYQAGKAAGSFYGEAASDRFDRLCRLSGLDSSLYATDATATTLVGAQTLAGVGMLDAVQQVTDSERGVVIVNGSGVLTYLSAETISNLTTDATLTAHDIGGDVGLTVNDQELTNDVTVTRVGGATQRRADDASIAVIGRDATTVDTLLTTDAEAGALADLLLSRGLVIVPRTDDLVLDLAAKQSTIDVATVCALDTGSRVTVTDLPTGAPASTIDLLVQGVAHAFTADKWDLTLTVTPAQTLPAWLLEDATLGVLDSTTRLAYP